MRARLAPAAVRDLAEIVRTLTVDSPSVVSGIRARLDDIRRLIGEYPLTGRVTDDPSLRCVNLGRYPYLVFFEVIGHEVVIMRIMHGARNPRSMPGRPR